jgi:hypothetical protein
LSLLRSRQVAENALLLRRQFRRDLRDVPALGAGDGQFVQRRLPLASGPAMVDTP